MVSSSSCGVFSDFLASPVDDIWTAMVCGEASASLSDTATLATRHSELDGVVGWHCFSISGGEVGFSRYMVLAFFLPELILLHLRPGCCFGWVYIRRGFFWFSDLPHRLLFSASDTSDARLCSGSASASCSFPDAVSKRGECLAPGDGGELSFSSSVASRFVFVGGGLIWEVRIIADWPILVGRSASEAVSPSSPNWRFMGLSFSGPALPSS